jgi:uncharacterized membrane protein YgdD (TMEM256/DUF423 family)
MHLALDVFQGIGIASAVGIRPFLPALAVGALGAADAQIDFQRTDYSFLQSWPFLLAIAVAASVVALIERRRATPTSSRDPVTRALALTALALGALLFAGALAQDRYTSWPGLIGGVLCATLGVLATRPLLGRVRARLGPGEAGALPAYAEGVALVVAVLAVLLPPLGLIAALLLAWLLFASRRREGRKYAGLRILR